VRCQRGGCGWGWFIFSLLLLGWFRMVPFPVVGHRSAVFFFSPPLTSNLPSSHRHPPFPHNPLSYHQFIHHPPSLFIVLYSPALPSPSQVLTSSFSKACIFRALSNLPHLQSKCVKLYLSPSLPDSLMKLLGYAISQAFLYSPTPEFFANGSLPYRFISKPDNA